MMVRRMLGQATLWLVLGALAVMPACGSDDGGDGVLNAYPEFEIANPLGICTIADDLIGTCAYNFEIAQMLDGDTVATVIRVVNTGAREMKVTAVTLDYTPASADEDPAAFVAYVTKPEHKEKLDGGGTLLVAPVGDTGGDTNELNVTVKYTRYDDGQNRTAKLTFLTDAANAKNGKIVVNLGTLAGAPKISASPEFVNFERVGMGSEKTERVNILNTGSMDLSVNKFTFTGTNAYAVTIGGKEYGIDAETTDGVVLDSPIVIPPQQTSYVNVKFTPTDDQPAKAQLVLFSNDPTKAQGLAINISGNEGLPCINVNPAEVHFGGKKWGQKAVYPVEISPCENSEAEVEIYGLTMKAGTGLSADFGVDFSTLDHAPSADNPVKIMPGTKVIINVEYTPDTINPVGADDSYILDYGVLIIDNNSFDAAKEVPIDGAGVEVECPTAVIKCAEGADVIPQTVLHLVGTQSFASSGAINKYEWSVVQPPLSASVFVPSYNYPDPTFEVNVAGVYEFSLDVWDSMGNESCMPAVYEVMVTPDEAIHVELLWHTPGDTDETDTGPDAGSDLDLHFAHPWANQPDVDKDGQPDPWFDNLFDCFWFNIEPDWGSYQPGVNDNPSLDRDDTDGAGPENMNLAIPENNIQYNVGVHYWNEHGYGVSYATVRVYIYGIMVFEIKDVLLQDQDMWDVATVDWPSGKVTQVPGQSGPYKITPQYANPYFYQ